MRLLRYLTVLGFFAAIGVALAIGLAVSTAPAPSAPASGPAPPSPAMAQQAPSAAGKPSSLHETAAVGGQRLRSSLASTAPSTAPPKVTSDSRKAQRSPVRTALRSMADHASPSSLAPIPRPAPVPAEENPPLLAQLITPEPPAQAPASRLPALAPPGGPLAASPAPADRQQVVPDLSPSGMNTSALPALSALVSGGQTPSGQGIGGLFGNPNAAAGAAAQVLQSLSPADRQRMPPELLNALANTAAKVPPGAAAQNPTAAGDRSPRAASVPIAQVTRSAGKGEGDLQLDIRASDADIREVLDQLSDQGNFNLLAGKSVTGKISVNLRQVDVDSALEGILATTGYAARRKGKFLYVGTPQELEEIEQSMDRIRTRVFRPNYVSAAELQALITPMLTEKIGTVSVSTPADTGVDSGSSGGSSGGGSSGGGSSGGGSGGGKGKDYAGSDAVVVRDYEAVLTMVEQLVAEIDVRPVQVAIEAMILSVTLDDQNSFGVDFSFSKLHGTNPTQGFTIGTGAPLTDLANLSYDGGVKLGFLDGNIGAFLNALESIGDVNVVATPRLTVMNKQKAEVLIGKSQGYTSSTAVSSGGTTVAQMTMLDTGTILRLRPNVTADGLIRMDVHPELSDGTVTAESGLLVPTKTVTEVTSNVMVRDGCTIIIGGLMQETLTTTSTQLPILGSLPLIGPLFRDSTEEIQKQEVLVLITPHIIYDRESSAEGSEAACEFHRGHQVYKEKMSAIGKRAIARCYFRLAQNAWAAGDRDTALRFAEMAVHFDPLNRAAIDLRATIWQGPPDGKHTLRGPGVEIATPAALDGRNVADWVLDDLEQESKLQPPPSHPLDPGQPGRHTDLDKPRRLQ